MGMCDIPKQSEPRSNVRSSTDRYLCDGKIIDRRGFSQALRIDAVTRNKLSGFAGKDFGFVLVIGARRLVEELANSVDQRPVRLWQW
jgi:hypothetical protein